jgi:hypothetical protein
MDRLLRKRQQTQAREDAEELKRLIATVQENQKTIEALEDKIADLLAKAKLKPTPRAKTK